MKQMKRHQRRFGRMAAARTRAEKSRAEHRGRTDRGTTEAAGGWAIIKQDVADVTRQYFAPVTAVVRAFLQSIAARSNDQSDGHRAR
jgi:hypothetical protein